MPSQVASCTHTERFYFLFPPFFLLSLPQENSPTLVITETARLHLSQHQLPISLTLPCYCFEALPASHHVACCLQAQAMLLRLELELELELAVPLPLAAAELRAQPDVAAVAAQLQLQQVEAAAVQQRLDMLPVLLVLRLSTRTRIDVLGFQRCDAISP